ncbi:Circadian clock protein period [Operophtera brumata]|uniref:Period circadian protein n=1 Tax=Operophtera brumata TaxID=104452 RepID=A0A0L7LHT5_OPEBR|nr:Circadian clock protein period [Operophtera brumata]
MSHSSSTHSGSNSSGSSGYGGKPSTSGSSNKQEQPIKKDKDAKKKKQPQTEVKAVEEPVVVECRPPEPTPLPDVPKEEINDVVETPSLPLALPEKAVENMDVSVSELTTNKDETQIATIQASTSVSLETSCQVANIDSDGFSCAVSMHDGVVMYTTQNLTTNLGFPKDMWIGRSFIDFVHPSDRNTFASQITNGLAVPKIVNDKQDKVRTPGIVNSTMVCRIRQYRSLGIGFGVKDRMVAYKPFLLKFSFKDIHDDDGKIVYLIIQATPIGSAFKCKLFFQSIRLCMFVVNGILEYMDIASVPYLGYLPQDIQNQDALLLYHPDDLPYLKMVYETIVREGHVADTLPYRMLTQNGDYVKLKTEWSSFINPWSMKLEFVLGKHRILEGPAAPDVFLPPKPTKPMKTSEEDRMKMEYANMHRENIVRILNNVLTKPAENAKQQMSKRCQDLAMIMESLLEDQPKTEEDLRIEIQEPDLHCFERDSVMLGGISPHHDYNDSKSSTGTPLSYNQLNYNENLQRYFDSHQNYCFEESSIVPDNSANDVEETKQSTSNYRLSLAQSSESLEADSSGSSSAVLHGFGPTVALGSFHPRRLTVTLLTKHNNEMEKELARSHREGRCISKVERALQTRQKKKEHLARCNATFQPTMAGAASEPAQSHALKRSSKTIHAEVAHKQHCSQTRQSRRRQTVAASQLSSMAATTVAITLLVV